MKRFDAIRHTVALMVQADIPVILWGPPGVGKSRYCEALGRYLNRHVMTKIGSIHEPTDFGGIPSRDDERRVFELLPPDWALQLTGEEGKAWVLFLDELTTCNAPTQAALLRIVLDRIIGHLKLTCSIIAAANPPSSAVGGMELAAPLGNRFAHVPWQVEADDYIQGTHTGWKFEPILLPDGWEERVESAKMLVANFLISRPQLVTTPIPQGQDSLPTFATPRTWDYAAMFLAATLAANAPDEVLTIGVAACIGEGPANEFKTWLKTQALIDISKVLANPAESFRSIKAKADVVKATFQALEVELRLNPETVEKLPEIITAALEQKVDKGSLGAFVESCERFVTDTVMTKVTNIIAENNERIKKEKQDKGMWEGSGKGWENDKFVPTPSNDDIEQLKQAIRDMQSQVKKP